MTDTDSVQEQTMRFYSELENNETSVSQRLRTFEELESSIDKLERMKPADGTETGADKLWSNKNYQFETKDPSFYQTTVSERNISNKIVSAINNSDRCSVCSQIVYMQEQIKALNKVYHKACFRCSSCNIMLQTNRLAEHGNDLYCQNCYEKTFGARRYGSIEKHEPEVKIELDEINEDQPVNYRSVLQARKSMSDLQVPPNIGLAIPSVQEKTRRTSVFEKNQSSDFKSIKDLLKPVSHGKKSSNSNLTVSLKEVSKGDSNEALWSKDHLKKASRNDKCPKCIKSVFAAEEVKWNNKVYHKICLRCNGCNKQMSASEVVEYQKNLWCKNCHLKMKVRIAPENEIISESTGEFSNPWTEEDKPVNVYNRSLESSKIRFSSQTPNYETFNPHNPPQKINKLKTNIFNVKTPSTQKTISKYGNSTDKCTKCHKAVYAVELVKAINKVYHKNCLKCKACKKQLETNSLLEHNNDIYCKGCYGKNFGPKGYGYGAFTLSPEYPKQFEKQAFSPIAEAPEYQRYKSPVPFPSSVDSSFNFDGENFTRKSIEKTLGGGASNCMRCGKIVYELEKVVALKLPFCKLCYNCYKCKITLSTKNCCEDSSGEIFCKTCFTKGNGLVRVI